MIQDFKKFYTMEPMKYYQPQDYENPKAKAMIENAGNQYICTKKNDGEWGRFIVDEGGKVTIQSRTISKVTGEYGNKTELLPHLVEQLKLLPPQTVFLGEICCDDVSKCWSNFEMFARKSNCKTKRQEPQVGGKGI